MVNEDYCYPRTAFRDKDKLDADREMEKLLFLIKIENLEYPLRTRAPAALQSNTWNPPPARFTRKKNSTTMTKHGQARPSMTSASADQPVSAHHGECAIYAPFPAEFDRIFLALCLDADYPDAFSSTLALNA
jgi:hypothetical protein